jgi:hypothetical protein
MSARRPNINLQSYPKLAAMDESRRRRARTNANIEDPKMAFATKMPDGQDAGHGFYCFGE